MDDIVAQNAPVGADAPAAQVVRPSGTAIPHGPTAAFSAEAEPPAPPRKQLQTSGHAAQAALGPQAEPQQQPQEAQVADAWYDPAYLDKAPPTHEERVHLGAIMRKDLNNS